MDAVIGDSILREIVCPDFFRSISISDLVSSEGFGLGSFLVEFYLIEPCFQY